MPGAGDQRAVAVIIVTADVEGIAQHRDQQQHQGEQAPIPQRQAQADTHKRRAFERRAQNGLLRVLATGYGLDAGDKDTDELVGLVDELAQPIRIGHLMFVEQLKPERTLLQFLQDDLKLGDAVRRLRVCFASR